MFESLIVKAKLEGKKGYYCRGRETKNSLGYAKYTRINKKTGSKHPSVSFYIGINLMQQARFIKGDMFDILWDKEAGLGLIKRMPNGSKYGHHICTKIGKTYGVLQFTTSTEILPDIPTVVNLENVSVDNEGILFAWPKVKG